MKILMHMCCAPCSVYPVEVLEAEGYEIGAYFYNPNIHPFEEFVRRRENTEIFCRQKNIPLDISADFRQKAWEEFKGTENGRCGMCYSLRLDRVAAQAKEKGYDAFTTSLLVSPYQKHETIRELGEAAGKRHGIPFYYRDFRPGFRQGQQKARELGLYRQKFCGCIISFNESEFTRK